MEVVEDQFEVCLVGLLYQVLGLFLGVYLVFLGQCFVVDVQVVDGGVFGQLLEVIGQQCWFVEGIGSDVVVYQYQVGVEFLYQVEFVFGVFQVLFQVFLVVVFEVVEWLEQQDFQVQVGIQLVYVVWVVVVMKQVVFEDFYFVEIGGGDGFEFFWQGVVQGYGGD